MGGRCRKYRYTSHTTARAASLSVQISDATHTKLKKNVTQRGGANTRTHFKENLSHRVQDLRRRGVQLQRLLIEPQRALIVVVPDAGLGALHESREGGVWGLFSARAFLFLPKTPARVYMPTFAARAAGAHRA